MPWDGFRNKYNGHSAHKWFIVHNSKSMKFHVVLSNSEFPLSLRVLASPAQLICDFFLPARRKAFSTTKIRSNANL